MAKIGPREAALRAMRSAADAVAPSPEKLLEVSRGSHEALGNPPAGTVIKVRVPPSFSVPTVAEIEARILADQRATRAKYMREWRASLKAKREAQGK